MEGRVKIVRQLAPNHKSTEIHDFNPKDKEALYRKLASYTDMIELEMEGCNLKDDDVKTIAEFLPKNKGFSRLFLLQNFIGPEGVEALAEAAKELPSLYTVNLARNMLHDRAGGEAVAKLLHNAPNLLSLNVSLNQLKDEGSMVLAAAVKQAPQLRQLFAAQVNNGPDGFRQLVSSVRDHPDLQSVNLMRTHHIAADATAELDALATLPGGEAKNLLSFTPSGSAADAVCARNKAAMEAALHPLLERSPESLDFHERAAIYERWSAITERLKQISPSLKHFRDELQAFTEHMHALPASAKDADGLFTPDANGFAPLDNPAIWRNPDKVLEAVERSGQELTPDFLDRPTPHGVTFLESALGAARISALLPALNAKGVQLRHTELLQEDGTPTPLFQRIIDRGDGGRLFTLDNWKGAHPSDMRHAADALPAEQRGTIAINTLGTALGQGQHMVRGR